MVTFTSFGRYAVLLSMLFTNIFADEFSHLESSSAAFVDHFAEHRRQLVTCCVNINNPSQCHPKRRCNANQNVCERSRCNRSGNYKWGQTGTSAPTNAPSPKPVSLIMLFSSLFRRVTVLIIYLLCVDDNTSRYVTDTLSNPSTVRRVRKR